MPASALETERTRAGPTSAAPMPAATGPRKNAKPSATDDSEFAETRSSGVRDSMGMEAKWNGRTTATAIVASAEHVTTTGTGADTTIAIVVASVATATAPWDSTRAVPRGSRSPSPTSAGPMKAAGISCTTATMPTRLTPPTS